jgi:hypothetical protein
MSELNRTEDQLTTADIAARTARPAIGSEVQTGTAREEVEMGNSVRPRLVRNAATTVRDRDNTLAINNLPGIQQDAGAGMPLFSDSDIGDLRTRWSNVQAEFVDEPRRSVEAADQLVASVMQRLAEGFANERASLEKQWDNGESASTEDLRVALQRYRAFFDRLLNAA